MVRLAKLLLLFTYDALRGSFATAAHALEVHCISPTLHGLRHGGASHDVARKSRDLHSVQSAATRKAFHSVRRYEKHGRLLYELSKLSRRDVQKKQNFWTCTSKTFDLRSASVVALGQILPQLDIETRSVRIKFPLCFADWSPSVLHDWTTRLGTREVFGIIPSYGTLEVRVT